MSGKGWAVAFLPRHSRGSPAPLRGVRMDDSIKTILIVEDHQIVRADLRAVPEEAGYEVCADATDGLEAISRARQHNPDLVLIDLGLPRLDGVETARWIVE